MLQYALLYLTGYEDLTLEDLKQFRQWGRKPWSPRKLYEPWGRDYNGTFGQGIANGVGIAMAEAHLAAI